MSSLNVVLMMGNLVKDVEVRQLPSGMAVGVLRLALNESYTTKSGERVDRPCFIDVEVWDKLADQCAKSLAKGAQVLVEGRLQMDTWDAKDGQKRTKHKVRAIRVEFLDRKKAEPVRGGSSVVTEEQADFQEDKPKENPAIDEEIPF